MRWHNTLLLPDDLLARARGNFSCIESSGFNALAWHEVAVNPTEVLPPCFVGDPKAGLSQVIHKQTSV